MLNALIIDDEPLARENLRCLLEAYPEIQIMQECANAIEAISAIHQLRPDVIFLDIHMPRIDGLEMLKMIDPHALPYVIFLTAYDEYAVKAFEEQVFDYLLKPLNPSRLDKTIQRLLHQQPRQDLSALHAEHNQPLKYLPCAGHSRIYLLNIEQVYFVSSRTSGIHVTATDGNDYFCELTLRTLEERTPLVRCHRQYLVNIQHLKEIRLPLGQSAEIILSNGQAVPISRRYFKSLKNLLGLI